MALQIGDMAPDFKLKATGGKEVSLSDFRGKNVVILFYPLDFSPVCSVQIPDFNCRLGDIRKTGAEILSINRDSVYSHEAWSKELGGVGFPMLSDMNLEIAAKYGVALASGISNRACFVVDKNGKIAFVHIEEAPAKNTLSVDQVIEVLNKLG